MTSTQMAGDQSQERAASVRAIAQRRAGERGPLLEILHDVQAVHAWVSDEDVREIADVLNLSVAEVHGVVSFYHDFRRTPPPSHEVRVCRAEACQSVGGQEVYEQVTQALAGQDDVEVREIFCFGNCALGPSVSVDGRLRGRMSAQDVLAAVEEVRA